MSLSVFMFHGFIKGVPLEIEEAAELDGCNKMQTFFYVVLPILKPIYVTILILMVFGFGTTSYYHYYY